MCLAALAVGRHPRFGLVLAANRDEYLDRPAAALDWWHPWPDGPGVLGGRDLKAGGTWMGLSETGRLALVTNVRQPFAADPQAPSRGTVPLGWLRGDLSADRFWPRTVLAGHAPFNLLAADFRRGELFWASNVEPHPRRLGPGLYGLSNALLDTPWPKLKRLKQALSDRLARAASLEALAEGLLDDLADRTPAPDDELPHTGLPLAAERALSPVFVETPDGRYGTRCSTLVITERAGRSWLTHVIERTHGAGARQVYRVLSDWPPAHVAFEPERAPA